MSAEQLDHHCVMNVDFAPWRILWIKGRQMAVGNLDQVKVADLALMDWVKYCNDAHAFLIAEQERIAAREDEERRFRQRREEGLRRKARELARRMIAHERLIASGYGPIDELEDEVELVDLEYVDPERIVGVMLQDLDWRPQIVESWI